MVSLIVVAGIYIRAITWAHMWGISYITVAAVLAPILFLAGCYLPNFRAVVPFLAPVGVISYSMYLTHMLVMAAFPLSEWSPVIRFCFWFIADIGLSLVVYRFIEAPANSLGHSLSSRWKPSL